jgi:putative endonuclease
LNRKQLLGKEGEQMALSYLIKEGYEIEATNFRCPFGEIDIIAHDGGVLTFVEVKTRLNEHFGSGVESINFQKQKRLNKIALYYLSSFQGGKSPEMCRFDVVSIMRDFQKGWHIELIRNAFPFQQGSY